MLPAILGRKIGMSRWFTPEGTNIPVTVIQTGPCVVTQVKTDETDGYEAIQIGYGEAKAKNTPMPQIGHDKKASTSPKETHIEFRAEKENSIDGYELGQELTISDFDDVKFVDIRSTSKGKGFQGGMKRHNFRGFEASHGVKRVHRSAGSINGHGTNLGKGPKLKKGKRMAGRMGNEKVTVRSVDIIEVDAERGLLIVKGSVPGPNKGILAIQSSRRLWKRKEKISKG